MKKYVCDVCGYVYDPAKGDPDNGVALAEEGVLQNTDRRSDDFQSVSRNFIRTRKSPFQYSSASRETGFSYGVVSDCMTFKRVFVFWHTLFSSSRDGFLLHQPVQSDFRDGRDGTSLPDSQPHFPGGLYGELQQPFVSDSCSCSHLLPHAVPCGYPPVWKGH